MNPGIKRFLSMLLALTMVFSLITPVSASAATNGPIEIEVGQSVKLNLNGFFTKTSWSSSDNGIATVSNNGTVTGVAPGDATITADCWFLFGFWSRNEKTEYKIKVKAPEAEPVTVEEGKTLQLSVNAAGGKVTWQTADAAVATVNKNGVVTGVAPGVAIVTAKITRFYGFFGSKTELVCFEVTVTEAPEVPEEPETPPVVDPDALTVKEGETLQLTVDAKGGKVTWSSSDEAVATVNKNGLVTGVSEGTVTIQAKIQKTIYNWFFWWAPPQTKTTVEAFEVTVLPAINYYTVTFETNGGSEVPAQTIEEGLTATRPEDPTLEGFNFAGWYADEELTEVYDFAAAVTEDVILYAKWEENSSQTLPDEIKDALGLAKDTDDSDSDGLTDYEELMIVGTDPLKYDTDDDGVSDVEDDEDNDGLSNLEEVRLGTLPATADSDFDGLNDYDEVNTYRTNPMVADSDGDGLTDGEEIGLGLDPLNPQTDGTTPDAERTFDQTASNDAIMDIALRNSDNWLTPSIEGNVPGNINNNILLEQCSTSAFNDNRAVLSDIIELSTNYESASLTLSFTYNESYTGSIENLTIASFGEDGLEIIDTTINESTQTLTGEIIGSGTYFVIDLDEFLKGLGIDVLANLYAEHDMSVFSMRGETQKVYAENTLVVDSEEDEILEEETETIEVTEAPEVNKDAEATEAPEANEDTEATEVIEDAETIEATEVIEDAETTEVAEVIEDTEATEAAKVNEITEGTEAPEANEDTETTEDAEVIEATKAAEATEVNEVTEGTEAPKANEDTETTEDAEVIEDTEAAEAAEVNEVTEGTEAPEANEDTEATEAAEVVAQNEQSIAMMFSHAAVVPVAADSATGKADVVFVIDTTGSMSGAISGVKNNINTFASKLVSDYNIDVNFALIDYRDITVDGIDSTVLHKNLSSNWYTSVSSFTNAVNSLSVNGGGDTPETPIDALEIARKLDWRGDSAKFVILVTDADYKNNNTSGIADMNEMSRKLVDSGIITSAITRYEDDYDELTTPSEGLFGYIYGDFSNILLQLAEMVGEETNADGEWVFLDDFQAVKLSDTLDNATSNDTDDDGLTDAQELGTSVVKDMLPYITSLTNRYDVPVESYQGKTEITVWNYKSNPVRVDTDYDGTKDKNDSNSRKWDISDRDLAISAGIAYTNLVKGANIDTYSSISLGSGADVNEMVGWTVLDTWHGGAGFYAAALKKDKNIILTFRGSKPGYDGFIDIDWIDDWVFADVINVMTGISTQAPAAQAFTKKIVNNYSGYNIYICGHSLGGNLALNASIKALDIKPSVVKRVTTFNGLGMPNVKVLTELFTWDLSTLASYKERFYDYEIEGDPVSAFELAPDHKWYEIFDLALTTGVGHRIVNPLKVSGNAHGLENFYLQMDPLGRPIN